MTALHIGLLFCNLLFQRFFLGNAGENSYGEQCLEKFKQGKEDFVLDIDDSVKEGATFISSPPVQSVKDCMVACCKEPQCNLALTENGEGGSIKSCFLINCLYKQKHVCKFVRKSGYTNYLLSSVFDSDIVDSAMVKKEEDKPPQANAGQDRVVQPQDTVMLNGIESKDDHKISSYEWQLVSGNPSVHMEKTNLDDQVMVSNLTSGVYKFQLTVTDDAGQSSSARVTILVLTPEQSGNHCMVPMKTGPCRGSFPRWHFNAASEKCEKFNFGGCKGNLNNYLSLEECSNACDGVSVNHEKGGRSGPVKFIDEAQCGKPCDDDNQFTCKDGCCLDKGLECDQTKQCSDGSDEESCDHLDKQFKILLQIPIDEQKARCTDPPATGPCYDSITNWYYDPYNRKCTRFNYGGCKGNKNRFEKEEDCMNMCRLVTEKDAFERKEVFEYQESQSQSGTIAVAVLLGVAILTLLALLGYCILKRKKQQPRHHRVPAANGSQLSTVEDTERLVYNTTTKPI